MRGQCRNRPTNKLFQAALLADATPCGSLTSACATPMVEISKEAGLEDDNTKKIQLLDLLLPAYTDKLISLLQFYTFRFFVTGPPVWIHHSI